MCKKVGICLTTVLFLVGLSVMSQPAAASVVIANFTHPSDEEAEVLAYQDQLLVGGDANDITDGFRVTKVEGSGGTDYDNATLTLSGLVDVGTTQTFSLGGGLSMMSQELGGGSFELRDSAGSLLLSGDISQAWIQGLLGQENASVLTLDLGVEYTGGSILSDLGYTTESEGSFSCSLNNIDGGTVVTNDDLADFTAYATGEFTIPEPATMALLGFGGIGLLVRRRRLA